MSQTRKNAGMSLVEVIIASIILVFIFGMSFMILWSATDTSENMSIGSDIENSGRSFAETVKILFREGWFSSSQSVSVAGTAVPFGLYPNDGGTNNLEARFQIPVGRAANGKLVFGYTDMVGSDEANKSGLSVPLGAGGMCVLRFEAEEVLRESSGATAAPSSQTSSLTSSQGFNALPNSLPVKIANLDMNSDGDKTDTFVRGKIWKYVIRDEDGDGTATVKTFSAIGKNVLLAVNASNTALWNGDMNILGATSGVADPLFVCRDVSNNAVLNTSLASAGKSLEINCHTGNWDRLGKKFILRANRETVRFQNPQ